MYIRYCIKGVIDYLVETKQRNHLLYILVSKKHKEQCSHSKGKLCTVAECGIIWAVHWGLPGEPGVKLANILV